MEKEIKEALARERKVSRSILGFFLMSVHSLPFKKIDSLAVWPLKCSW